VGFTNICPLDAFDDNRELCEMTDYNDGQIHGWNGGECPVHPETVVKYWMCCGGTDELMAGCLRWEHLSLDTDIIAFQVVKAYVEPKVIWVNEYAEDRYAYITKQSAINCASPRATRIAVKYVEVVDDKEAKDD
jgi:hypothetical protein